MSLFISARLFGKRASTSLFAFWDTHLHTYMTPSPFCKHASTSTSLFISAGAFWLSWPLVLRKCQSWWHKFRVSFGTIPYLPPNRFSSASPEPKLTRKLTPCSESQRNVCVCVCVCVCERERERVCVCVCEREREPKLTRKLTPCR